MIFTETSGLEKYAKQLLTQPAAFTQIWTISADSLFWTANEGPVKIQYQCLVPIYVFPEMNLRSLVISKTEL
jgi:hypothetical protein